MRAVKYGPKYKAIWDQFIAKAKNGVFLFYRDYMEYHSDRFRDHSALFFDGDKLVAVMPANLQGGELHSHGGLTFGGIVSDWRTRTSVMLEVFDELRKYAAEYKISRIVYKAIPHIYHRIPAEEDLYALYRNSAELIRRDVSSSIFLQEKRVLTKGRKWSIKKSKKKDLVVKRDRDFKTFMAIEADLLDKKYGVSPTHTADEIQMLAERFPDNIKLFAAYRGTTMLGGVIVYESPGVAHTQYIAANEEGEELGAAEFVLDFLINEVYSAKRYFDFGISTEENGLYLNRGLIRYKESFGARAVVHDFYQMDL